MVKIFQRTLVSFLLMAAFISCEQPKAASTNEAKATVADTSQQRAQQANNEPSFAEDPVFMDGDIIFQTSGSGQSQAIQLATHSKYSHVGMIINRDGEYFVYEAVQPVCVTPLASFIDRGDDKHYVVKRVKERDNILREDIVSKIAKDGMKYIGKNYDLYFGWSDERIYCSELVYKLYKEYAGIELGKPQKLKEFDLTHPIVKAKLKERYGDKIPMEENVISPAAIFDDPQLFTVMEK